jgi:hypothetical protein
METLGFCDKSSDEYVKCFLKFMFLHSGLFKILTIHFANCIVKNSTDETNISLVLVIKDLYFIPYKNGGCARLVF